MPQLKPVDQADHKGRLYAAIKRHCPACKSAVGYFAGPRGGASQNIMCHNPACRMEYNVCELLGWAEVTGRADEERWEFFQRFPGWHPKR